MTPCPRCEAKGRPIESVTLEAQVGPDRIAQLAEHKGWGLCTSDSCEVVCFRDNEVVVLGETRGVPFHKSEDPQRLVCFCFEHSVAELEADVAANGTSTIQASIKAECKAGRDDCQRKNPQGRCCLGNVGQVVKQATPVRPNNVVPEEAESCCTPKVVVANTLESSSDRASRGWRLGLGRRARGRSSLVGMLLAPARRDRARCVDSRCWCVLPKRGACRSCSRPWRCSGRVSTWCIASRAAPLGRHAKSPILGCSDSTAGCCG